MVQNQHSHGGTASTGYTDITAFGSFHSSSSHTSHGELHGGRTPITTEAMVIYNALRAYMGEGALTIEEVGQWAFDNTLTNNTVPYGQDLSGVGLYYAMQAAKVAWIRDDAFDPQLIADIQRTARLGDPADVMDMVQANAHPGFYEFLVQAGLEDHFINTLKMEPHYGGWMHGRVHGWLEIPDGSGNPVAIAHDINHLTVLSHDQMQPFMNDTFDWPQWPALNVSHQDVIDYFQSIVLLGDPLGSALPTGTTGVAQMTDQADVFDGTVADDVVDGKGGDDVILGGLGDDNLEGGGGKDTLRGQKGEDILRGEGGADVLVGNRGADFLHGGNGADRLFGGKANDVLRGGGGNDFLNGGPGNDTLFGGTGADAFQFGAGKGRDKIRDFEDDIDTLRLNDTLWSGNLTVSEVIDQFATETGGDVVFTFAGGERITVEGIADASLLVDDILIV